MRTIIESVTVEVPLATAYNQWTQFETFPQFMEGVQRVRQIDDTHLHWEIVIGTVTREFDALITEQHPDERIAWRSTNGPYHAGDVSFECLDSNTTRVTAKVATGPVGAVENIGDALGAAERSTAADLERFKQFIEAREHETGSWRGNVDAPHPASVRRRTGGSQRDIVVD